VTQRHNNVVEQTMRISARPETVWKYWTDPQPGWLHFLPILVATAHDRRPA